MRDSVYSVALFLFVIGTLLVMTGATGGGLALFLPGMICWFVASFLFVRSGSQP